MFGRATMALGIGPHSTVAFLVIDLVFSSNKSRDWLGRTFRQ